MRSFESGPRVTSNGVPIQDGGVGQYNQDINIDIDGMGMPAEIVIGFKQADILFAFCQLVGGGESGDAGMDGTVWLREIGQAAERDPQFEAAAIEGLTTIERLIKARLMVGTPEDVAKVKDSYTGQFLRELLKRRGAGAGGKKEAAE